MIYRKFRADGQALNCFNGLPRRHSPSTHYIVKEVKSEMTDSDKAHYKLSSCFRAWYSELQAVKTIVTQQTHNLYDICTMLDQLSLVIYDIDFKYLLLPNQQQVIFNQHPH